MNATTEQYNAYYNYMWTHWHKMEERILFLLYARNIFMGI